MYDVNQDAQKIKLVVAECGSTLAHYGKRAPVGVNKGFLVPHDKSMLLFLRFAKDGERWENQLAFGPQQFPPLTRKTSTA